jgi:hypothetical protein
MSPASFQSLRRREIAGAVRERKRTLYEISRALGRRPGDIQRTLRQMHAEKLLHASDPEPGRGTFFWFNDDHADALEQALAENLPPGQLGAEQRVLAIKCLEDADPYQVLGRKDLNGPVAWVAEWGGDGEFLVGMASDAPKQAVDRLVRALHKAGVKCTQRRIGEVLDRSALRHLTEAVDDVEEAVGA